MVDPQRVRWSWIGGALVFAVSMVGCVSTEPPRMGDPAAPIIVRGAVREDFGTPIPGATLRLAVLDYANPRREPQPPVIYADQFVSNADGSFEIHLAATPALQAFAKTYSPWVAFDLTVLRPFSSVIASTQFSRQLENGEWVDAPAELGVTPSGITINGVAPRPPVPGET